MTLKTRQRLIRGLTLGLVILAFANSYRHGVVWALAHSPAYQSPAWAYMIAAFPELLVILAVLSFPEAGWGVRTMVPGVLAVSWTLWANGSAAAPGVSGLFIALSPAIVSLIGLALAHRSTGLTEPEPVAQAHGSPVAQAHGSAHREPPEPVQAHPDEPVQSGSVSRGSGLTLISSEPIPAELSPWAHGSSGSRAQRIEWAQAQTSMPSSAQIRDHTVCSLATAKRVRSAAMMAGQETG